MRTKIAIDYWIKTSKEDFRAAESLFEKRLYPQCLFFCHLSLEKLLKALVVKTTKNHPPFIHDLQRLAEIAKLDLTKERKKNLDKIFTFNIAGRYANEKIEFYKKHNKREHAKKYLQITKDLSLWLKKEFQKK